MDYKKPTNITIRKTKERLALYEEARQYYPSLPNKISSKGFDRVLTILIDREIKNNGR